MTSSSRPSDDERRRQAVRERGLNLIVDAGAGTGKTGLLVDRLIEMVAPEDDGHAYAMERVAAITFTRRASGELRFRIRSTILSKLGDPTTKCRRERLLAALGELDTAFIGTIHSFADRLLRLFPVEAGLSPSYDIVDDEDELILDTYLEMRDAAQNGTLGIRFAATSNAALALEVQQTLVTAIESGLVPRTNESDAFPKVGIDLLVRELLRRRDCSAEDPGSPKLAVDAFRRAALEYHDLVRTISGAAPGELWMLSFDRLLREAEIPADPKVLFGLVQRIEVASRELRRSDFGEKNGVEAWRLFQEEVAEKLMAPIRRWMACRLVRMGPIVGALYEETKRRRQVIDSVDLLLKLALLLRTDFHARETCQRLFDHLFVDEFQDTDPLQAEIILFLGEERARAKNSDDVVLGQGRLTLVGDPKQSIYRFRRADITIYQKVYSHVRRDPKSLSITLDNNFRSGGSLVGWFNERFTTILGARDDHTPDSKTGRVPYTPLVAFQQKGQITPIHVLPFAQDGSASVAELRDSEGEAIGQYTRWLVEGSGIEVTDPETKTRRHLRYSDIAVLAQSTTQLQSLFQAFESVSVPYSAAGGTVFLRDAVHRQFILGLRALSDPDDGVAEAALMRPPFFSTDLWDLVQARAPLGEAVDSDAAARGSAARQLVQLLRRERFIRSPGSTARRLLEETAFGRLIALGSNGEQRLRHLRELCAVLDRYAVQDSLDFDGVTALARSWIDWPVQLDPPRPIWSDAVQVTTVHQAKGLEFPVVILWDACAEWRAVERSPIYVVDPSRKQWALHIHGLKWQEPAGTDLLARAQEHASSERRRVVYVAATRAREILILASAPNTKVDKPDKYVNAALATPPSEHVQTIATYSRSAPPPWVMTAPVAKPSSVATALDTETRRTWLTASSRAKVPLFRPTSVTAATSLADTDGLGVVRRKGRFGAVFGNAVHRAIALTFQKNLSPADAVERSAMAVGLRDHLEEAAADVVRAVDALSQAGISAWPTLRFEYPVGSSQDGSLTTGWVDLVALNEKECVVIDFKTDCAPSVGSHESHSQYVAQVRAYITMLAALDALAGRQLRGGLLWTATGSLHWI